MLDKISVISVRQPYAQLLVMGAKQFETRSWDTKYRGTLYIHASQNMTRRDVELCRSNEHFRRFIKDIHSLPMGGIVGRVELISTTPANNLKLADQELAFGNYSAGWYAWLCAKPVEFAKPLVCGGRLGLWKYELPITVLVDALDSAVEKEVSHG